MGTKIHSSSALVGNQGIIIVKKLVWFEAHGTAKSAIAREKQIKGWLRVKKIALIESVNPNWDDWIARLHY